MYKYLLLILAFTCMTAVTAQDKFGASSNGLLEGPTYVPSIREQIRTGIIKYADNTPALGHPKRHAGNNVVPGKGSSNDDPLVTVQNEMRTSNQMHQLRMPELVFVADQSQAIPSDPTGAIGPNHYVAAWNSAFRIFDRDGMPLTQELALGTLFPGNNIGDPIVFYDAQADRFVITEFDDNPNGFNLAISMGPNPVTDGWHIYTSNMGTGAFPDYTKFSIWGNAYYVTANVNNGANGDRLFAVERNQMLAGNPSQFVGFPLPGIATNGFYSPQAFSVTNDQLPPDNAPATIVYMQDDAWGGVAANNDHLKLWNVIVDWNAVNDTNATFISNAVELGSDDNVTEFISVFDGGGFSNRPQGGGVDIDVLQATIMNQAQYRRFPTYNSAVFNFVVDTDGAPGPNDELAGVRWYELRQTADGQPWTVFQEGTYTAPDGRDAYSASMAMDDDGNIAMAYTSSSETDRISIRYTGRFADDAPNVMTALEETIFVSTAANPSNRLADYVQLSVDPVEPNTFWHIAEVFDTGRQDVVAKFTLTPPLENDAGVASIDQPESGLLTNSEDIVVSVRNFGSNDISNIPVSYSINGGAAVNETVPGTLTPGEIISYTFSQTADLSIENQTYTIVARTNLTGDNVPANDPSTKIVTNAVQYCIPTGSDCTSFNDGIIKFVLGDIVNDPAACTANSFDDQTGMSTVLDIGSSLDYTATIQTGFASGTDVQAHFWIDFNDDGDFEDAGEEIVSGFVVSTADVDTDVNFSIPANAPLGMHRLRTRAGDTNFNNADPVGDVCGAPQYGRTADYTVNIVNSLSVPEFDFSTSELLVISKPNNQFEISLITNFDENASIKVLNLLGQTLAFNNLSKTGDRYVYNLDMSYAASGVYLIQFGSEKHNSFKTAKIIVN